MSEADSYNLFHKIIRKKEVISVEKRCQVCDEGISNPLCSHCLEEGSAQFLADYKPTLVPLLRARQSMFSVFVEPASVCINCKDEMKVCPHCYCKEVALWLYEDYPDIAQRFVQVFNYDLKAHVNKQEFRLLHA